MFKYNYKSYELLGYGTLKYTKGLFGGLQEEQFNDVKFTLKNFIKNTDKNIFTFALLDGTYFNNKIKELNSFDNIKNKICSSDEIINEIKQYCIYWLKTLNVNNIEDEIDKFLN